MELIKINPHQSAKNILKQAVQALQQGHVLIIPTETSYGLAADATNLEAVKKIYRIKGRSFKKFLPLIVSSQSQLHQWFKTNKLEKQLIKKYPGVTFVLTPHPATTNQPQLYLLKNQSTCAVRISLNNMAKSLAKKLDRPITATSANLSGQKNCYSINNVIKQFEHKDRQPDLILNAGRLPKRKPSTIVQVEGHQLKILRQGEIKILNFKL
jgi:L-threonylcarbamoyladenylate synthase